MSDKQPNYHYYCVIEGLDFKADLNIKGNVCEKRFISLCASGSSSPLSDLLVSSEYRSNLINHKRMFDSVPPALQKQHMSGAVPDKNVTTMSTIFLFLFILSCVIMKISPLNLIELPPMECSQEVKILFSYLLYIEH